MNITEKLLQLLEKPKQEVLKRKKEGEIILPSYDSVLNALKFTPDVSNLKAIIIGQDPYHTQGYAHGLSFSVLPGVKTPKSLVNIFKEINSDIGVINTSGYLEPWAKQGVLLLNKVLTVEEGKPGSHKGIGWEEFTETLIQWISSLNTNLVFMLWGKEAQAVEKLIDRNNHLVLKAPHPSPFSAHTGFFGCKHFSKCNEYLIKNNKNPIDWRT